MLFFFIEFFFHFYRISLAHLIKWRLVLKKSVLSLALASTIAVGSNAYAGGMANPAPMMPQGLQWGVSVMYNELIDDMAIGLSAQNEAFEFGVDGSIADNKNNAGIKWTEYYLGAFAGMRALVCDEVYGAVGFMGNYGWLSSDWANAGLFNDNPYTVGVYVGLEYQPKPHLQVFAKIMPYSREKNTANQRENEFFQEGQLGITYFWS